MAINFIMSAKFLLKIAEAFFTKTDSEKQNDQNNQIEF